MCYEFNHYQVGPWLLLVNQISIIVADALDPCINKTLAAMVLMWKIGRRWIKQNRVSNTCAISECGNDVKCKCMSILTILQNSLAYVIQVYINELVQARCNSSALAMNYNTRSTQKSPVRQQNAWFNSKKPGSTQKCLVRQRGWQCPLDFQGQDGSSRGSLRALQYEFPWKYRKFMSSVLLWE